MKRLLTVFLLLLGVADVAFAQAAPLRLTLDEAIARGIEASHRLEELGARQEAARAIEDQREAAERPQLAVAAGYTRINHVDEFSVPNPGGGFRVLYPDLTNRVQSRIDLQWSIYTGGRLQALTRAAGAEVDAAGQDREAARADLKLEITRSFLAVTTARASLDVVRQALERTDAHLNDVRNQLSVGLVPPSDVLQIEAQQAHQRMLSIEAENIAETTSAEFKRLVGLEQGVAIELAADFETRGQPGERGKVGTTNAMALVAQPANAVISDARASRPERKSLLFRISAAEERVAAASAGSLPALTAIAGYDMARPTLKNFPIQGKWEPSWDIGVSIRRMLFDGGRVRAETAEAAANQRATEARLRDFDSVIEVEIRQRMADLNSARASIEAADAGVRAAMEARRVLAERFSAGVATNTDVLGAQTALLQAELDLTRARANAALAGARLDRALGR
ncbi:MAG TPA: TolC family protein [Vicinamibacterales bacterium]